MLPELAEIFYSVFFTWAYVDVLRDLIAFREIGQERAGIVLNAAREFTNCQKRYLLPNFVQ